MASLVETEHLISKTTPSQPQVTLTSTWKEIRRKIKHDPRFSKFSDDDKVLATCSLPFLFELNDSKTYLVHTIYVKN